MGFLEERDLSSVPSIPKYFSGKKIFITGGSGFMGKVLIEKLLYSCSDLDRIYLLLRTKKGVKPEDRLANVFSSRCFDRVREERPGIIEAKVFAVSGDAAELGLGLSEVDRAILVNDVDIIFHVAASVRFDDPLKFAVKLNLRGTREVVELAKEIRNLSVLVHVSTSYTNTNRKVVEERIYPPHADWRETLNICENFDDNHLQILTSKYLGGIPNTYTFTKQLAEHAVYEEKGRIPAIIIRPSIVISSVEEPFPGWIENFNGPVGLLVACGKGIMRSMYSDPNLVPDYMPVDISIKGIIAAAWIRGTKKLEPTDDVPVYNSCCSNLLSMTMGEMLTAGQQFVEELPLNETLWMPGGFVTTSRLLHYIKVIFLHLFPAILVDIVLWALGRTPMLVKVQRRIYIATIALGYFVINEWKFINENFIKLRSLLKDEDKKSFYYEIENVDQYEFFRNSIIGARKFLLNEKDEDLPKARVHQKRLYVLDIIVKCILYGYVFWWIINTKVFNSIFSVIYNNI